MVSIALTVKDFNFKILYFYLTDETLHHDCSTQNDEQDTEAANCTSTVSCHFFVLLHQLLATLLLPELVGIPLVLPVSHGGRGGGGGTRGSSQQVVSMKRQPLATQAYTG